MRFLIDSREAFHQRKTGKGQWARGFIQELLSRNLPITLLISEGQTVDVPNADVHKFPAGLRWHFSVVRFLKSFPEEYVYISPTSFIVTAHLPKNGKALSIVHDLIAFQSEPHNQKAKFVERILLKKALNNSAVICTASEATKQDLLAKYPDLKQKSIQSIFAGPMEPHPAKSLRDQKIILCAGTLCPRKNQLRLIQAFNQLPDALCTSYQLILIGARGWQDEEIIRLAEHSQNVSWKKYVSDAEYKNYFSHAAVFAFPSLYEGFGMAVLDALQRGIPVLTSDRGSLKEVAGNAALAVDPESTDDIARGLQKLLTDQDLCAKLANEGPVQAATFSWKKTVDLFQEAAKSLVY